MISRNDNGFKFPLIPVIGAALSPKVKGSANVDKTDGIILTLDLVLHGRVRNDNRETKNEMNLRTGEGRGDSIIINNLKTVMMSLV